VTLHAVLLVASALLGLGVWGALSQQSFVMLMMGFELMLAGVLLAVVGCWALATGDPAQGQLLAIVVLAVMAVEMAIGLALVTAVYRQRQADTTESLDTLKR
jgi:NAD(P)H-quinone oxidoreductase subunit 4L